LFPLAHGSAAAVGPDPRDGVNKGVRAGDMYVPDIHIDALNSQDVVQYVSVSSNGPLSWK
jgi:hypothetical protein